MWTSSSWWKEKAAKAFPFPSQEPGSGSWLVPAYTRWECQARVAAAARVGARA